MTTFQLRVARVVQRIPRGRTLTYAQVAARAGYPLANRAVGNFLKNYDTKKMKLPCHRVVAAHGIGGYRWGTQKKKVLLRKEGVKI